MGGVADCADRVVSALHAEGGTSGAQRGRIVVVVAGCTGAAAGGEEAVGAGRAGETEGAVGTVGAVIGTGQADQTGGIIIVALLADAGPAVEFPVHGEGEALGAVGGSVRAQLGERVARQAGTASRVVVVVVYAVAL